MNPGPSSSRPAGEPDEAGLAVLVACHHRGPLTAAELAALLSADQPILAVAADLTAAGLLEAGGGRYAVTQRGREYLDGMLEAIERQLTPDAPAYERRYRRRSPTLPFDTSTTWAEAVAVNFRVDPAAL